MSRVIGGGVLSALVGLLAIYLGLASDRGWFPFPDPASTDTNTAAAPPVTLTPELSKEPTSTPEPTSTTVPPTAAPTAAPTHAPETPMGTTPPSGGGGDLLATLTPTPVIKPTLSPSLVGFNFPSREVYIGNPLTFDWQINDLQTRENDSFALYTLTGDSRWPSTPAKPTGGRTSGTMTLDAPLEPGQYEVRYLNVYQVIAKSEIVEVVRPPASLVGFNFPSREVYIGNPLTFDWQINDLQIRENDSFALYTLTGDSRWPSTPAKPTGGRTSGTMTLDAPLEPGQYEVRYLNVYQVIAKSEIVEVVRP